MTLNKDSTGMSNIMVISDVYMYIIFFLSGSYYILPLHYIHCLNKCNNFMCMWNKLVLTLSIKAYSQVHYGKYSNEMRKFQECHRL